MHNASRRSTARSKKLPKARTGAPTQATSLFRSKDSRRCRKRSTRLRSSRHWKPRGLADAAATTAPLRPESRDEALGVRPPVQARQRRAAQKRVVLSKYEPHEVFEHGLVDRLAFEVQRDAIDAVDVD